ncbi:ABC transporter permease subunit [Paenibacillus wenxiniae]|uniref:ABC transporter permease subunit n=1 Tax=Paenibacillus wenxiniae TaxID=1636843 RepID=A0ABW4RHL1_9BACL
MNTIIGMTWKELLRKKVMLMTLVMTILFLVLFWFIASTLTKDIPLSSTGAVDLVEQYAKGSTLLTLGFFFGSFILAFLVIFSSFSSISGEAELGIMQATLTRPVPRWKWYIGRWLGYVSFGVLYALLLYVSIIIVTDIHTFVPGNLTVHIQSFLVYALAVPILITLSLLGSTAFSALGNGVFMTMFYGAGWLGGMVEKFTSFMDLEPDVHQRLNNITGIISFLMPVDALQRKMMALMLGFDDLAGMVEVGSSLTAGMGLGQVVSGRFIVYAVLYTLILLLWGTRRFNRKEL